MLPRIRALGLPAALVAQDGIEHLPIPWHEFDRLFIGGCTDWKLSEAVYALAAETAARGKWTHMGRVYSWARLADAAEAGYRSADGTTIAFNPGRYAPEILRWLYRLDRQLSLPLNDQRTRFHHCHSLPKDDVK